MPAPRSRGILRARIQGVRRAGWGRALVATLAVTTLLTGCAAPATTPTSAPLSGASAKAGALEKIVLDTMSAAHLKAALVRVTVGGEEVLTRAFGESMTGVPATTAMHFRNGAVAISYVATLLLRLVDQNKVSLDDKLAKWLPDMPNAERVTLGQLAQMTSGYPDYVLGNAEFEAAFLADPFRQWTPQQLLDYAVRKPLLYPPGTNWNYAHTNYVLLGLALEKATGEDIATLLRAEVLDPLGLNNTTNSFTPAIPEPVLHAFSSERRQALGIPAGTSFYEDSTFWNPSWTITHGAVQTTTIYDLAATAAGVGSGRLLSPESYRRMVSPDLRGRTHAQPGCPTCGPQTDFYTYGLGVVISGDWLLQNPMFGGYAAIEAYLPAEKIVIAVAVTYGQDGFDPTGDYHNEADTLFRRIGAELAPAHPPPLPPAK